MGLTGVRRITPYLLGGVLGVISTEGPVMSGRSGRIWSRTQSNYRPQPNISTEFTLSAAEWARHDRKRDEPKRCLELSRFDQQGDREERPENVLDILIPASVQIDITPPDSLSRPHRTLRARDGRIASPPAPPTRWRSRVPGRNWIPVDPSERRLPRRRPSRSS